MRVFADQVIHALTRIRTRTRTHTHTECMHAFGMWVWVLNTPSLTEG